MKKSSYEKYLEKAEALRSHPLVMEWIKAYQKNDEWKRYPNCERCDFPHAEGFQCFGGATFGEVRIGHDTYYIDLSNVVFFVDFRQRSHGGFHWKNDIYFKSTPDLVEITSYWQYNNVPQERKWRIPRLEWQSIIESTALSAGSGDL